MFTLYLCHSPYTANYCLDHTKLYNAEQLTAPSGLLCIYVTLPILPITALIIQNSTTLNNLLHYQVTLYLCDSPYTANYCLNHSNIYITEQLTAPSGLFCIYVTPLCTTNYCLDHTELSTTEQLSALSGYVVLM